MMIPGLGQNYMDNLLAWLAAPHREAIEEAQSFPPLS
jgi:hypothetical protein